VRFVSPIDSPHVLRKADVRIAATAASNAVGSRRFRPVMGSKALLRASRGVLDGSVLGPFLYGPSVYEATYNGGLARTKGGRPVGTV